jgi:hypothetical protein
VRAVSTLQLPLLSDLDSGLTVVEEGGGGGGRVWVWAIRQRAGGTGGAFSHPRLERIPVLSSACSLLLASYGAGIMASVSACVGP